MEAQSTTAFNRRSARRIESGQWAPGSVIPPERKMAEDYGVSLGTVRTAILNLVSEGLLYRIQGKGTLVSGTRMIRESIRYYRFVSDFGRKEAVPKLKLLDIETIENRPDINRRLKIRAGESLYRLRRLVLITGKPVVYAISYLPCQTFHGSEGVPPLEVRESPSVPATGGSFRSDDLEQCRPDVGRGSRCRNRGALAHSRRTSDSGSRDARLLLSQPAV